MQARLFDGAMPATPALCSIYSDESGAKDRPTLGALRTCYDYIAYMIESLTHPKRRPEIDAGNTAYSGDSDMGHLKSTVVKYSHQINL